MGLALAGLDIVFLADHAWMLSDAVLRTLYRLFVSRRHMLEWTPASRAMGGKHLTLKGFTHHMAGALVVAALAMG